MYVNELPTNLPMMYGDSMRMRMRMRMRRYALHMIPTYLSHWLRRHEPKGSVSQSVHFGQPGFFILMNELPNGQTYMYACQAVSGQVAAAHQWNRAR